MKELDIIAKERKLKGLTWDDLAKGLPINGNALRMAIVERKKVHPEYLPIIRQNLNALNTQNTPKENLGAEMIMEKEIPDYIIENEARLLENNAFRFWLKSKVLDEVNKILGDQLRRLDKR